MRVSYHALGMTENMPFLQRISPLRNQSQGSIQESAYSPLGSRLVSRASFEPQR
jgi:hypothetical protein